jgi:hypothetical protein
MKNKMIAELNYAVNTSREGLVVFEIDWRKSAGVHCR